MGLSVLLLTFNRPGLTRKVFEAIKKEKPDNLYFACDGPRTGRDDDIEKINQIKTLVAEVDWPCNIRTRFLEKNLGCGLAVSSAIEWFLNDAGEGIILEDDCLPTPAFFRFCAVMLDRYRNDLKVGLIAGSNMAPLVKLDHEYDFSRIAACWGWATWNRTFSDYKVQPNLISDEEHWTPFLSRRANKKLKSAISKIYLGNIHTWDYQLLIHVLRRNQLTVVPRDNLILNIGFNGDGAHYKTHQRPWWVQSKVIDSQDQWSEYLLPKPNTLIDKHCQNINLSGCSKLMRFCYKLRYYIAGV